MTNAVRVRRMALTIIVVSGRAIGIGRGIVNGVGKGRGRARGIVCKVTARIRSPSPTSHKSPASETNQQLLAQPTAHPSMPPSDYDGVETGQALHGSAISIGLPNTTAISRLCKLSLAFEDTVAVAGNISDLIEAIQE